MTLGIWCINTPTHSLIEVVLNHVFCTISQSFLELDSRGAQQWPLNKGYCHYPLSFPLILLALLLSWSYL